MQNKQCNIDIRERTRKRGLHLYEIAYELGLNDGNFSRRLRRELSPEEKQEIFAIIDRLSNDEKATVKK